VPGARHHDREDPRLFGKLVGGRGAEVGQAALFQPDCDHPVELLALADVPGEEVEPWLGQERVAVCYLDPGGDLGRA
jgi:hypothetical protein